MGQPCNFVAEDASNCQGNTVGGALEFFAPKYGALIGANISSQYLRISSLSNRLNHLRWISLPCMRPG